MKEDLSKKKKWKRRKQRVILADDKKVGLSPLFLGRSVKTPKSSGSHVCVSLFSISLLNQTEKMQHFSCISLSPIFLFHKSPLSNTVEMCLRAISCFTYWCYKLGTWEKMSNCIVSLNSFWYKRGLKSWKEKITF